ncbi:nicotinate phosphoribosyltransferase [Sphingomonas sp. YR710]|uniref:nicotinate phosphoribosyltransferase n=1 Tax=Sphingomonas sp. YR710 TaxID=1882773 RepID=UPI000884513D|nr:nicotinate phosphoribosyltransferase [Sphingomonas sp. YR710]SDD80480.1 nicotinate phosphoribosyltransferase [Sphingomonas sp. YR710]
MTKPLPDWPGLLATDLYQLTMLDAYRCAEMGKRAVFEFFSRRLPPGRGFLMAAGLATLLETLESAQFSREELEWLGASGRFSASAIERFAEWRFTGDVDAAAEGTLIFANEPILRIEAPIAEAQLVETLVINRLHYQTLIASKAARFVLAAPQKQLIDFGLRRAHSLEAGILAARAAYIAGFAGTASALAASRYGLPVFGTMAHSFVQAHESEEAAFLDFAAARPADATFLIDTYDTEEGARMLVRLAARLRARGIAIRGVRIDSGDLTLHARAVRTILDDGGLQETRILVSGGIDELSLATLVEAKAPIDGCGIGTSLTTSQDAPALDCAYKLVAYAGQPRRKRSEGKVVWPGAKQVFRRYRADGQLDHDIIGLADEAIAGEALLQPVMRRGRRLATPSLDEVRAVARDNLARLPSELRDLRTPAPYRVDISTGLLRLAAELAASGR